MTVPAAGWTAYMSFQLMFPGEPVGSVRSCGPGYVHIVSAAREFPVKRRLCFVSQKELTRDRNGEIPGEV